jgi:hypothetical protein
MKKLVFAIIAFVGIATVCAQSPADKKYSPQQLKEDAEFLKKQLFDAHADPFTELNKQQYEQLFANIEAKITDSLNITEFYKLIKPVFSYLSDEHSGINIDTALMPSNYRDQPVFPPFSLIQKGDNYFINDVLTSSSALAKGERAIKINGVPVAELVELCSHYTSGFPDQRRENALKQFGYLYAWAVSQPREQCKVLTSEGKVISVNGVSNKTWTGFLKINNENNCPELISYTRYGDAGYLNACSFLTHGDKELDAVHIKIDSLFKVIKSDQVKYLFIDVSHNSGGDSSVGDMLINDFSDKPYNGYQCNFRRSDEYLKLSRSWGSRDSVYASMAPGSILHSDSYTTYPPQTNPNRFHGKVYIIIGEGTFSSAMMFATIVKDNHLATLIGQTPRNGHPTHFGEMYGAKLPNTKLPFRFGVKEWIRPAGKMTDNYLRPDAEIEPGKYTSVGQMIKTMK